MHKKEDTFSTLSLKPKILKFISVEKYQTATFPHTKTQDSKLHLLNENEDSEMLLQKVRYQQTDFSSRQPRKTMAEMHIIFYCQRGVSPLSGEE